MITVSIAESERDLSAYVTRAVEGEVVVLTASQVPVAEIKPIGPSTSTNAGMRPFGLAKGEIAVPDDFDCPLPDELLREFEGGQGQ